MKDLKMKRGHRDTFCFETILKHLLKFEPGGFRDQ